MHPSTTLRRVGAFGGQLALLAVLAMVATAVLVGAPRLANRYTDQGLQNQIGSLDYRVRDLRFVLSEESRRALESDPFLHAPTPWEVGPLLRSLSNGMAVDLRSVLDERQRWHSVQVGREGSAAYGEGLPVNGFAYPQITLRMQSGVAEAVNLVVGEWPRVVASPRGPIPAAVSAEVARRMNLKLGSTFELTHAEPPEAGRPGTGVIIEIVGIFSPIDPTAPIWDEQAEMLEPFEPLGQDNVPWRAVLAVDLSAAAIAIGARLPVEYGWRFRVDERRLAASRLDQLVTAVAETRRQRVIEGAATLTGLDGALARFAGEISAVRALFAIVQTGVLATLFGLTLLAARAIVDRRQQELALLRVRGGTALSIGGRLLAESTVVVPVAVAVGWYAAVRMPGRPGGADWLAVLFGLAAMLAVPVLAGTGRRGQQLTPVREDLVQHRPSTRRVTAELGVLVLAALGLFLLRRRGLSTDVGVDPYLVSVPVLLAAGAAVVALRLMPWPLRQLGRLAARARSAVPFVGLAGASRAAPASVGPLAVMVVAISTGVFSAVVVTTIAEGRDRAASLAVPADALMRGWYFTPETTDSLADLPGVIAVAATSVNPATPLLTTGPDAHEVAQALVVVVDGPALANVLAVTGTPADLPAALTAPRGASAGAAAAVPAVVSPSVAARLGEGGAAQVQGVIHEFRVAAVRETFPSLEPGTTQFVVLPLQALPQRVRPIAPTGFLIAGEPVDPAELAAVGDLGQREFLTREARRPVDQLVLPTTVTTRSQYRRDMETSGVNQTLSFTFAVGAAAGTALVLLAVGFAVVAGARARGRMTSRLRTMGLSRGQGRRLFVYELVPVIAIGALIGAAVGVALPALAAPALGLSNFTGGVPAGVHLDPRVVAGVLALVAVNLVVALIIEAIASRRMRVGEVLRLGEET